MSRIVSRLQRRQSTATLRRYATRCRLSSALLSKARVAAHPTIVDLPLLGQLADAKPTMPRPENSRRAGVWHPRTAQPAQPVAASYPVKNWLKRLPRFVLFTDEHGLPLVLHAGSVLSYRDVLLSRGVWLSTANAS
ncbi:microcompartment protein PduM [Salmonella enterica subsp. enterica]|nr:microcompartment protein PduM [Salmonella enterica subsp. enterica]